ncbi:hydrogenase formation protein HypD [Syntrophus aciditrophicus]|uniref:Hydrogenase isoenzymes formation protein n=1 Tax=Syntrophus aciditrophicus (strain SB) TaxID=56780 RepID=Q2LVY3_SYNAS|nr:hydrogenase formation protein HypD [Syntrophus aciditrophicus]ABC78240.1 hydrogenase isoenzymes formation protein [Syntrophus aciditrophicus SB]
MKFIDEYRDPDLVRHLLDAVAALAARVGRRISLMEICGTHTHAIGRFGIRRLLPENIRLISGPGCPVCVTSIHDVDRALYLADRPHVVFATFGDMLRVPGTGGRSLQRLRAAGADVRIVSSTLDSLRLAEENPEKEVVFMGIGFETTAPTVASAIRKAGLKGLNNYSVFSVHKTVPQAISALIEDPELSIDGFICPGHVSVITGVDAYKRIPETGRAAVITGFEPVDILEGILMILRQLQEGRFEVAIQYARGVNREGNPQALNMMGEVFETREAEWRGLGRIPQSGLFIRERYADFDALRKGNLPEIRSIEFEACRCGEILRGVISPEECRLFGKVCTPANPVGPCMVSSEGTCAAYLKYEIHNRKS